MAGEREVKAQIKLRLVTVDKLPFVVTRSMALTQKQTKQEWKTLDSSIQSVNKVTKEVSKRTTILNMPTQLQRVSHSYKCADVDKEVPDLMGVSKPVLENVIFCHQEESNWPLQEGSKLKKKFDDIFAATR